jgi:uracil phosphoribosyltransferase
MQVCELNHSLARHHLDQLRSKDTVAARFRHHLHILSLLLTAEATRDLQLDSYRVQTPMETMDGAKLSGRMAAIPIMRAGLGMVSAITELIPDVEVWHLGLYRDEATAQPVHYYDKLPSENPVDVAFLLDPMLATGGSACAAIDALRDWGVPSIVMLSIISAPEGIAGLSERHPDVTLYTGCIDRQLNDQKFILPGLGDAGDRIFNTSQ